MALAPASLSDRISQILWQTDLLATRVTLSLAAIMTGIMIALYPGYWVMSGAYIIAAMFVIQGAAMGWTVLRGWHRAGAAIYADAVLGCALWSAVCATNLLSDPWHYSDAAHLALAAASWWSLVRWDEGRADAAG